MYNLAGSYSNALEEFAEAKIFQHYLEEGKLVASTGIKLEFDRSTPTGK